MLRKDGSVLGGFMLGKIKEMFKLENNSVGTVFNLNIEGMHCNSCVNKVKKEVNTLSNVKACSVFLEKNLAVIEVKEKNKIDEVIKKISDLGYNVKILE